MTEDKKMPEDIEDQDLDAATGGSNLRQRGDDGETTENVTMNFAKVKMVYHEQSEG